MLRRPVKVKARQDTGNSKDGPPQKAWLAASVKEVRNKDGTPQEDRPESRG